MATLDLQCQLRVQEKMLTKESQKEEREANKERNKAKLALKKGDRAAAQYHAQNAIRCQNHAQFLLQNASRISSMVVDLKMSDVQKDMAKNLDKVVKEMQKSVGSMNMEALAAAAVKYDAIRGKVSEAGSIINQTEAEVEGEGMSMLEDLENEIMVEMDADAGLEIPTAGQAEKTGPSRVAGTA